MKTLASMLIIMGFYCVKILPQLSIRSFSLRVLKTRSTRECAESMLKNVNLKMKINTYLDGKDSFLCVETYISACHFEQLSNLTK